MHDDMRNLLNATLDGELHGTRLLEMKRHLATCAACRNELKELSLVSDLLQAAPAPEFMPVERFVSNLALNLPRRELRDRPPKPGSLAWWLVPAGLLGAWFFVRTVFTIAGVIAVADGAGLLGQVTGWFGNGQAALWFPAVTGFFGGQAGGVSSTLSMLNEVNVIGADLLNGFLWQAVIALLYWGWLALWWFRRSPRPIKGTATSSQS